MGFPMNEQKKPLLGKKGGDFSPRQLTATMSGGTRGGKGLRLAKKQKKNQKTEIHKKGLKKISSDLGFCGWARTALGARRRKNSEPGRCWGIDIGTQNWWEARGISRRLRRGTASPNCKFFQEGRMLPNSGSPVPKIKGLDSP